MTAYLNHGRWVVECPAADCRSALLATEVVCDCDDRSVCDHDGKCGTPLAAIYPDDAAAIARIVAYRPRENRNWYPGETVAGLKAENVVHGVRI